MVIIPSLSVSVPVTLIFVTDHANQLASLSCVCLLT